MFKKVTIDGKEVELAANAATPFRFKQVFQKDLLQILGNEKKAEEEGVEAVTQLAYIMAKQAEGVDMNKLTFDEFIAWLEGFSAMAFIEAAEDIVNAYMETTQTSATP
jgi:hypothetical protein